MPPTPSPGHRHGAEPGLRQNTRHGPDGLMIGPERLEHLQAVPTQGPDDRPARRVVWNGAAARLCPWGAEGASPEPPRRDPTPGTRGGLITADGPTTVEQGPFHALLELAAQFTQAFPELARVRFEQHLGPMPDGQSEQLADAIDTVGSVLSALPAAPGT
ncbi:hypothetical protein, partial [Actinomadura sp. 6K520]|uniref:hypothetical protein n=1 Tax=Actinomadura sp. 6K520 TaxID=2530364 RepID=UPI0010EB47AE